MIIYRKRKGQNETGLRSCSVFAFLIKHELRSISEDEVLPAFDYHYDWTGEKVQKCHWLRTFDFSQWINKTIIIETDQSIHHHLWSNPLVKIDQSPKELFLKVQLFPKESTEVISSVYLVCNRSTFRYFEDYCDNLLRQIKRNLNNQYQFVGYKLYDNENQITIEKSSKYLFCNVIPENILEYGLKNFDFSNIYVINTEQLTRKSYYDQIKRYLDLGIVVADYNQYQTSMCPSINHVYVPYQYDEVENSYLFAIVSKTPKIYDVAFCSGESTRRKAIYNELVKSGVKVLNVVGWKSQRDQEIAKAKILINIHYTNEYQIYENLRCDRWLFAGLMVVSEDSLSDETSDIKNLIIIEKYENLTKKICDILKNYDQYYNLQLDKVNLYKESIAKQRLVSCQNFSKLAL
jgi:hypothetical protein